MMKHKKPLWLKILLGLVALGLVACVWEFISSQNPYLLPVKRTLKYDLLGMTTVSESREQAGLAQGFDCQTYVDGQSADEPNLDKDSKRVYDDGTVTRLVNYLDGYQLDLPAGAQFDFSLSPLFIRGSGEGFDVTASRESASYQSLRDVITFELSTFLPFFSDHTVEDYVLYYEYRFLLSQDWQANNNVSVTSWTSQNGVLFLNAVINDMEDESLFDGYLYATYYTSSREYVRVLYRYHSQDEAMREALIALAENTRVFDPVGQGHYDTQYQPDLSQTVWSEETQALYDSLSDFTQPLKWGIFLQDFLISGFDNELTDLEEALDYTFPVILYYRHLPTHQFPTEVMEENYEAGRLVELTLQLTDNNNEDMFAWSPMLAIYRGSWTRSCGPGPGRRRTSATPSCSG